MVRVITDYYGRNKAGDTGASTPGAYKNAYGSWVTKSTSTLGGNTSTNKPSTSTGNSGSSSSSGSNKSNSGTSSSSSNKSNSGTSSTSTSKPVVITSGGTSYVQGALSDADKAFLGITTGTTSTTTSSSGNSSSGSASSSNWATPFLNANTTTNAQSIGPINSSPINTYTGTDVTIIPGYTGMIDGMYVDSGKGSSPVPVAPITKPTADLVGNSNSGKGPVGGYGPSNSTSTKAYFDAVTEKNLVNSGINLDKLRIQQKDPYSLNYGKTDAQVLSETKQGAKDTAYDKQVQAEIKALSNIPGSQYYGLTHPTMITKADGKVYEQYSLGGSNYVNMDPKTGQVLQILQKTGAGQLQTTNVKDMQTAIVANFYDTSQPGGGAAYQEQMRILGGTVSKFTEPILKANNMLSFSGKTGIQGVSRTGDVFTIGGMSFTKDMDRESLLNLSNINYDNLITKSYSAQAYGSGIGMQNQIDNILKRDAGTAYTGISSGFTNKSQLGQANFQQMGGGSYRGYEGGKVTKNPFKQFTFNSKELRI